MAMMFGSQETIHAVAYSYLNETLGLEDFKAFLQDEATMEDLTISFLMKVTILVVLLSLWHIFCFC
jgi:ribonucleotide reductase beta subunit family protein with ferritin-like domain